MGIDEIVDCLDERECIGDGFYGLDHRSIFGLAHHKATEPEQILLIGCCTQRRQEWNRGG